MLVGKIDLKMWQLLQQLNSFGGLFTRRFNTFLKLEITCIRKWSHKCKLCIDFYFATFLMGKKHCHQSNVFSLYLNIRPPSFLHSTCDYSVFKENIEPMWEVPENTNGGRWLITVIFNDLMHVLQIIFLLLVIWIFRLISWDKVISWTLYGLRYFWPLLEDSLESIQKIFVE